MWILRTCEGHCFRSGKEVWPFGEEKQGSGKERYCHMTPWHGVDNCQLDRAHLELSELDVKKKYRLDS